MSDIEKHLERAEKYLSKSKYDAAIEEYKAAFGLAPANHELLRSIADLYVRGGKPGEAVRYYGELFDKYAEKNDATKAVLLFRKSLASTPQPPERYAKLGALLQRTGKNEEAGDAYRTALDLFQKAGNAAGILDCLDHLAAIYPDNPDIHVQLAEQANRMGKPDVAGKAFLRAGQLLCPGDLDRALDLLQRAHDLAPDRTTALSFAQAHVDKGNHQQAAELLLPLYAESSQDLAVLETLGSALLAGKRLREAAEVLELFYQTKPDTYEKLFQLVHLHCQAGEAEQAVEVLGRLKQRLFAAKRQKDFVEGLQEVYKANDSLPAIGEFAASVFNELNQESRYFGVLGKLFELYHAGENFIRAADTLERLIDIDPYDFNNQERLKKLKGKLDEARLRAIASRITSAATVSGQASVFAPGEEKIEQQALPTDPRARQALLEDMMVQVEIFIQYSLMAKAIEKLQKVYQLFPGEEGRSERLYKLYAAAQYFPPGFAGPPPVGGAPGAELAAAPAALPPSAPAAMAAPPAETASDMVKMAEITHVLSRQTTPKTVLQTAVTELGKHLRSSRCLGVLGRVGATPSTAVEFCSPGVPQSPGPAVVRLLGLLGQANLDSESGAVLSSQLTPELRQVGAQSVLAMPLLDKEKQEQVGLIALSQADQPRQWKPTEVYLAKAVAAQVETAITHLQLRSMMRKYAVSEEGGLLGRASYLDTLVSEVSRSKAAGTPLVVALVELDRGSQLLRQVGEAGMQQFMQQAAQTLMSTVRQSDIGFRYTLTSLAVLLNDTTAPKASPVVEKLRKQLGTLKLPGGKDSITFSAALSEAAVRPDYDPADIVTDVINRAEASLEAARQKGNTLVAS